MFTLSKRALPLILVALIILAGCSRQKPKSASPLTKSVSGTVVKIADGDTITIVDAQKIQHKIRLQGIDAPERKQDYGAVSREHLGTLVFGKLVKVEYEKVDWRGRLVGKVLLDGKDECLEQVKEGLAWHYKEYEKEQSLDDRQLYATAEQEARAQKRGLWTDRAPTAPWDYRHRKNGSPADTDLEDEPVSANHHFRNAAPLVDRNSPNALTSIAVRSANVNASDIRGNKRRMIYHWPGCPNYDDVAPHNRVLFGNREEAEKAGYRAARNCS